MIALCLACLPFLNAVVEVSFEKGMYSISETDGNLLLQVSVQHGSLSRTVTLLLSTHNGSATGQLHDL